MTDHTAIPLPRQTPGVSARRIHERSSCPDLRRPASLYVHIPFCAHKCHYCDFYSIVDRQGRQAEFTDRLCRELASLAPFAEPLLTIFIGGGTPTLLEPQLWDRLLRTLRDHFNLSHIDAGSGEFSVECNPETATPELFSILRAGGVNRLSMGAQTFNPHHLKTLERWHDPDNVARAVSLANDAGIERTSIDLIFAIPGQTLNEWDDDLARVLDLGTTHLSCYALTYEPGTAMTARRDRGQFTPAPDDLETEMYEHTVTRLADAGLGRYEVSNFARFGEECRHNLAYWRQSSWLAAGPSASGHLSLGAAGGHRWKNTPRLDDYLRHDDSGFALAIDHEPPDPARALAERLMTAVRLREGFEHAETLAHAAGISEQTKTQLARVLDTAVTAGWLTASAGRLVPTASGFLVADHIARNLIGAVSP